MKTICLAVITTIIVGLSYGCSTMSSTQKMRNKACKEQIKAFKKEGWKISGSSKNLELALFDHYESLNNKANQELIADVSQCKSLNICKQVAFNNAVIDYANKALSTIKGRVMSDVNSEQSEVKAEFDKMYAAYERLVQGEIRGVISESFSMEKDNGKVKQYRVFYLVNEEKAAEARRRAMEHAMKESEMSQQFSNKISGFVQEGFKINE